MSKPREYRPPRPGDKVGDIDGWPDSRGLPTIRVVCEGRREKGTDHKELVVATFVTSPWDPSKGECGNWWWDSDAAVGGGPRHPTTRLREEKAKRLVTLEEEAAGWLPGLTEVNPKRWVGDGGTDCLWQLACTRCPLDLRIRDADWQPILDDYYLAGADLPAELVPLLHLGQRKLPLPALIALRTTRRKSK